MNYRKIYTVEKLSKVEMRVLTLLSILTIVLLSLFPEYTGTISGAIAGIILGKQLIIFRDTKESGETTIPSTRERILFLRPPETNDLLLVVLTGCIFTVKVFVLPFQFFNFLFYAGMIIGSVIALIYFNSYYFVDS